MIGSIAFGSMMNKVNTLWKIFIDDIIQRRVKDNSIIVNPVYRPSVDYKSSPLYDLPDDIRDVCVKMAKRYSVRDDEAKLAHGFVKQIGLIRIGNLSSVDGLSKSEFIVQQIAHIYELMME